MVEKRLVEAASVLRLLPPVRVQGYFSTRPKMLVEFSDLVGRTPAPIHLPPPSAAGISRMEATLDWLTWLEPIDSKIVWMRASGRRWKAICWSVGLGRAAAHEHWLFALCVIAWRLNGSRGLLQRVSRRRFIGQVYRAPPAPTP